MNSKFYLSMVFISLCEKHVKTTLTGINTCGNYKLRQKPDGRYHKVLEMTCCPDFMEVDNRCLDCPQNSFGNGCNSTCTCDTNSRCHPVTGECLCEPGFNGKDCSKECSAGFYGPSCIYECKCSRTSVCNTQTGECTCDRGWIGKYCDRSKATDANNRLAYIIEFFCCVGYKAENNRCVIITGMVITWIIIKIKCAILMKRNRCNVFYLQKLNLNVTCAPNCNRQDPKCSNNGSHLSNSTTTEPPLSSEADTRPQTKEVFRKHDASHSEEDLFTTPFASPTTDTVAETPSPKPSSAGFVPNTLPSTPVSTKTVVETSRVLKTSSRKRKTSSEDILDLQAQVLTGKLEEQKLNKQKLQLQIELPRKVTTGQDYTLYSISDGFTDIFGLVFLFCYL
ncbi:unnamed protein product [Mytilus coruscus]|uniref:EGF-like domain-containing protein n=1 Tax=Mytilus coruscus TaxID=42192 RepID=A0A6J7ZYW9_MYTCO|nr:unnamed protein product [Mytilus coruscus]